MIAPEGRAGAAAPAAADEKPPLLEKAKESWRRFKEGEPGRRFQERYRRRQEERQGRWDAARLFNVVAGLALLLGGLFLIPAPGPGWGTVFLGGALLGGESLPVARLLDRAEVALRSAAETGKKIWGRLPPVGKLVVGLVGLAAAAALGYGVYALFSARR